MDKLLDIVINFFQDPTLATFGVVTVVVLFRWKVIEEYFSYRFLKKYEHYINAVTDSNLKKLLSRKRDQEVLFKITGIRQVDIAKKVMKLLVHPSLILYKRDLNCYKDYFDLDNGDLILKEMSIWVKSGHILSRILAFLILVIFAIFFMNTIFSLLDIKTVTSNLSSIIVSVAMSVLSFIVLFGLSSTLYINNEEKMQELLKDFNNSENN